MVETINAGSEIASATRNTILCQGDAFDNIIDEFGVEVVIRVSTRAEDVNDPYADDTVTYTEYRRKAFVNMYTEEDDEVKEGLFRSGTILLYFKSTDASIIKAGVEVWYDHYWWSVSNVTSQTSGTYQFPISAMLKRA